MTNTNAPMTVKLKSNTSLAIIAGLFAFACSDERGTPDTGFGLGSKADSPVTGRSGGSATQVVPGGASSSPDAGTPPVDAGPAATPRPEELRTIQPLMQGWRFVLDDALSEEDALAATGKGWQTVDLPHTWNAEDAASLQAEGYRRGIGWYRLEFETPPEGDRHWIEFGAASMVADVWLNGKRLGQHRGAVTQFRFDVTDALAASGTNVLLVRVDNRSPRDEDDPTAIDPLGGDFNVSGGLYRHVELISTPAAAHFALDDLGGPGVYATTTSIAGGDATVSVRSKLTNTANQTGNFTVRVALVDADGQEAGRVERAVPLEAGEGTELTQDLSIVGAHLWQGRSDPYLYWLVAELLDEQGAPVDRVIQSFGIREMRFDPNLGFMLNGQHVRFHGAAMHQDFLGKGWAITNEDIDKSLDILVEMGANAVRLGHYTFPEYALQRLSELGLVAWAEKASGLRTTVDDCSAQPTEAYMANARQQLQETIRQGFNYAGIAMWSIGNETEADQLTCEDQVDNVTPYLRELHELAKSEDPARATANAEFSEGEPNFGRISFHMGGITDVLGTNRYFGWYNQDFAQFGPLLDQIHEEHPEQSIGVSEYGAGAALTHHTDNPRGGLPEVRSAAPGQTSFQPEEYQAYFHEENYRLIQSKPYLWGSFIWNMFDFGSDHRNEGDVLGVNTKGLVSFDRETRKDAFFFYKANWSSEPVTYITSRRYTDRAYSVVDVKVYSNADSLELFVNEQPQKTLTASQCDQRTCTFQDVQLLEGVNIIRAVGNHDGTPVTDSVEWSVGIATEFNIAAGRLASGYVSTQGTRFGSDDFFAGGRAVHIDEDDAPRGGIPEDIEGTEDPLLYKYLRVGSFSYQVPLPDGSYDVTLGFIEPDDDLDEGERVFDVTANGETLLEDFDVLDAAGDDREVVTRTFTVNVSGGRLLLDFTPSRGQAMVSNLEIRPSTTPQQ